MNIKLEIKRTLETVYRIFNKNNLFRFKYRGERILFFLPIRYDWIQQQIIVTKRFYEQNYLERISSYLDPKKLVLDIGSNIGNHVIYFSKILGAKVYAFEPQRDIFKILSRNIEINGIARKVKLFNIGLGKTKGDGYSILNPDKNNSGSAKLSHRGGNVKIDFLDNLIKKESIGFIKIDTEGYEGKILLGAKKVIKRDYPKIWVEIKEINRNFIIHLLKRWGYKIEERLDEENFIFVPNIKS